MDSRLCLGFCTCDISCDELLQYKYTDVDMVWQTDELLKHHGLRFVTSSFERKATLAAKERAALEAKEKSSGSNEGSSTVESKAQEKNSNGAEVKAEDGKLGPAKSTYAIASSAASYIAFQTKSFLPFKSSPPEPNVPKEEEDDDIPVAGDDDEEEFFRYLGLEAHIDENSEDSGKSSSDEEVLSTEKRKVASPAAKQTLEVTSVKPEGQAASDLAPVVGAAAATGLVASRDETKDAVSVVLQSDAACPSEWFVCDEEDTHTRYFVIQGSDSLASWQANLLFESSLFEVLCFAFLVKFLIKFSEDIIGHQNIVSSVCHVDLYHIQLIIKLQIVTQFCRHETIFLYLYCSLVFMLHSKDADLCHWTTMSTLSNLKLIALFV